MAVVRSMSFRSSILSQYCDLIRVGHINHTLFWTNLAPASNPTTSISSAPKLSKEIEATFGSFDTFKKTFNTKTAAVQGSGWGWLVSCILFYLLFAGVERRVRFRW